MSKAFVNEDAQGTDDELDLDADDSDEQSAIPRGSKNYITEKGLEKLKAELHELLAVERPKLVETVAWAASNGDRSENADYQYGKRRLREIDRRVRFLHRRIEAAEVVDPTKQKGTKVLFGATVTVADEEGIERTYRIVGVDETDAKSNKVSWIAPVGQALLQANEGDAVTLKTPRGDEELEILKVEYKAID